MSNPWGLDAGNQSRNIDDLLEEYHKRKRSAKALPRDFKCEYCSKKGTREAIKEHQKKCKENPANRRLMSEEDFSKAFQAMVAENIRKASASKWVDPYEKQKSGEKGRHISVTPSMPLKKILAKKTRKRQGNPQEGGSRRRRSIRRKKSRRKSRRKKRRRSRKSSRRRRKRSSCKRRRVRRNKDGTLNKEDMDHNTKCYNKNFLKDNPWMLEPWALKQVPHPEKI